MRTSETWTDARLRSIEDITPSIRRFDIAPEDGGPTSHPIGGHINVAVTIDGKADTRSYSLVGAPVPGLYRIAVKRLPQSRGGSAWLWSLVPGARLRISRPASDFPIAFDRPEVLLIAGGIGITPILGMALALAGRCANVRMAYAVRSRAELAFADDLSAALGDRLATYVSREGARLDLAATLGSVAAGGLVAVCGPLTMLDEARRVWRALGRPVDDLRFETFGSSGAHAPEAFRVRVPRLQREIDVPAGQSLLDALEAAGIGVIADCRRGECGVCALNLLEVDGTVDHRDVFLSEREQRENRRILACVSRAIGTIVIDPLYRPDHGTR